MAAWGWRVLSNFTALNILASFMIAHGIIGFSLFIYFNKPLPETDPKICSTWGVAIGFIGHLSCIAYPELRAQRRISLWSAITLGHHIHSGIRYYTASIILAMQ